MRTVDEVEVDEMERDEMRVEEMGSRRSGNKPCRKLYRSVSFVPY